MKLSLSKSERLKSKKLIESLFKEGKEIYNYPLKLLYIPIEKNEEFFPIKFGVTVSKRKFKSAVTRNLLKRRMREVYRINKIPFSDLRMDKNYAFMLMYMSKKIENSEQIQQGFLSIQKKFIDQYS